MKKKIFIMMVALLIIIPLLAGCSPVTMRGGGTMPFYGMPDLDGTVVNTPVGKTSFSFTVESYNIERVQDSFGYYYWKYDVRGRLRYSDRAREISINERIEEAGYLNPNGCLIQKICTIDGMERLVSVMAVDNSILGTDDTFTIVVYVNEESSEDPADIYYVNHGPISSGNITIFYPEATIPTPTPVP